jgi:hypothetical protein
MKCNSVKKQMPGYLLGELSEIEKKSVEKHIDSCPECAGELKRLREVFDAISKGGATLPPEYYFERFPSRVMERLRENRNCEIIENRHWLSPVWAAGAVAAALVLAIILFANPNGQIETLKPGGNNINLIEAYENDPTDPVIEVSGVPERNELVTSEILSHINDYSDDYYPVDETVTIYIDGERYSLSEEEFEEILKTLKERFLG